MRRRGLVVLAALAAFATPFVAAGRVAAASGPIVSATPSSGLVDGEHVTVHGSGWTVGPGDVVGLCEGPPTPGAQDPTACFGPTFAEAYPDNNGNITADLTVLRKFGSVDCDSPKICAIGAEEVAAWGTGGVIPGAIARVDISFAPVPIILPGVGSVVEGNSGTTEMHVPVALSKPWTQTITAQWTTVYVPGALAGQADPATDYTPASGTVTFAPGQTTASVPISVNGDTLVEPNEYIVVSFTNPTNANMGGVWGLGFGVIINDD